MLACMAITSHHSLMINATRWTESAPDSRVAVVTGFYRRFQRMGAGLALLAVLALIFHGTAHASRADAHPPVGHEPHLSMTSDVHAAADVHHHHAGHATADHQNEPSSTPDGDCCCGGSAACAAVMLPALAVLMPQMPSRAGPVFAGNRETGVTPQGLRRPPRTLVIA